MDVPVLSGAALAEPVAQGRGKKNHARVQHDAGDVQTGGGGHREHAQGAGTVKRSCDVGRNHILITISIFL